MPRTRMCVDADDCTLFLATASMTVCFTGVRICSYSVLYSVHMIHKIKTNRSNRYVSYGDKLITNSAS